MKTTPVGRRHLRRLAESGEKVELRLATIDLLDDLDEVLATSAETERLRAALEELVAFALDEAHYPLPYGGTFRELICKAQAVAKPCASCGGRGNVLVETTLVGELRGRCERCGATGVEPDAKQEKVGP